ncbi:MAG: YajQ family cyclic di-GMP-binding protein [Nitrospinales bacterium]
MASKSSSFDIVSTVDLAEMQNAVNQAMMEIRQRFDFKKSKSSIELDKGENQLILVSDNEPKLKSVIDILESKLVKRGVPLKGLDYGKVEAAAGDTVRQVAEIRQGISQDKGREIVKFIKGLGIKKVQGQIQDGQLRVTGKNRDDLQTVIAKLREKDFDIPMTFTNYR